ncbi:hypothetical protein Gpo141_00002282 [Globisporangium polare]
MPALASITPSVIPRAHEPSSRSDSRAVTTSTAERVYQLVDVRRGASLSDVRVEVNVAHTTSRLKARFFVEMRHVNPAGVVDSKWGFGVFMSEVKSFESQLLKLVKKHSCSTGNKLIRQKTADECVMCATLKREVKTSWSKLSGFGKRHMDAKCERVTAFFYKLLRLVHASAQWLHTCSLLREVLRRTEELCRLQYPNDGDAVCVIEALKRVPSLQQLTTTTRTSLSSSSSASVQAPMAQEDCAICLSSLRSNSNNNNNSSKDDAISGGSLESAPPRVGVELLCGHRFHDTCICLWFHTRLNCPICRTHAIQEDDEGSS